MVGAHPGGALAGRPWRSCCCDPRDRGDGSALTRSERRVGCNHQSGASLALRARHQRGRQAPARPSTATRTPSRAVSERREAGVERGEFERCCDHQDQHGNCAHSPSSAHLSTGSELVWSGGGERWDEWKRRGGKRIGLNLDQRRPHPCDRLEWYDCWPRQRRLQRAERGSWRTRRCWSSWATWSAGPSWPPGEARLARPVGVDWSGGTTGSAGRDRRSWECRTTGSDRAIRRAGPPRPRRRQGRVGQRGGHRRDRCSRFPG